MDSLFKWLALRPIACVLTVALATAFWAQYLPDLKVDTSANGLIIKDSPAAGVYEEVKRTFGDDTMLVVVYKAPDIFIEPVLQSIEDLTLAAEQIDGVSRVISLSTASNLKGSDGYLNTELLMPYVPSEPEDIQQIKEDALGNQLNIGEVVNASGTLAAIQLSIESRPDDVDFDTELVNEVEALLVEQRNVLGSDVTIYQAGSPMVKATILDYMSRDMKLITPLALFAAAITLLFFFRSPGAIVLPAVTGAVSVVLTLGFMAFMGFALNPITLIIPALLLVIGSTEDIHILSEYASGIRSGMEKRQAIERMARRCGFVILLTSLTTVAGFLTIVPNQIPMLREFAIGASFGITANFIITVLLAPAVLRVLDIPASYRRPEPAFMEGLRETLISWATTRRRLVFWVFSGLIALSVIGTSLLYVDTNYLLFFRKDAPVRVAFRDLSENLSGASVFYVVVDSKVENGMQDPEILSDVAKLTDFLSKKYDGVLSFDTLIRKSHQEMNEGDESFYSVPESEELIAQYSILMNPEAMERFIDFDYQRTCLVVRSSAGGSREINTEIPSIRNFINDNLSRNLDIEITGEIILVAQASDTISQEILLSILYMLVTIFVLISLLFFSVRAGLRSMIPNVLPILVNFGIMGFMGIPISASTFPIAIIALGIAVDDTIHFMVRFSKETKKTSSNEEAIARTISHELRPVFSTSVALCLGYIALTSAEFGSIAQFGALSAVTMLTAFIGDLVLTPALLLSTPIITSWDLLGSKVKTEILKTSPFFNGLNPGQIKRAVLMGVVDGFKDGETMLTQGETGRFMYVILSGKADVKILSENHTETRVAGFSQGDIVGELSLLADIKRSANVTAVGDVDVLRIDADTLERIAKRFPRFGYKIYQNLSAIVAERLMTTNKALADS
ncbi:MAG: MMPL family transporter [Gammaproteobacteria bacterium]|nr:MMPL family transporter [Gammaproteobacteria bacterium]